MVLFVNGSSAGHRYGGTSAQQRASKSEKYSIILEIATTLACMSISMDGGALIAGIVANEMSSPKEIENPMTINNQKRR